MCKLIYNKFEKRLDKVVSSRDLFSLPKSDNMNGAIKSGLVTDEEISEYCDKIQAEKLEEAKKTGKIVIVATIGIFFCENPYEECNWDVVYEVVNPEGEIGYIREHTY